MKHPSRPGRGWLAVLVGSCVAIAACASGPTAPAATSGVPSAAATAVGAESPAATSPIPSGVDPLVGTWLGEHRCELIVKALHDAGLDGAIPDAIVGNGLLPGVTSVDGIRDPAAPCEGSVVRAHSHYFRADGEFGSLDWAGRQVDGGEYKIIGPGIFALGDTGFEFKPGDVSWAFVIEGDSMRLRPILPADCTSPDCQDAHGYGVMVALPWITWQRVGP